MWGGGGCATRTGGGVGPDKPVHLGRTPLSYTALSGDERIVKILLGREEANPDRPDNGGRMPLSYAAQPGHAGVVKILLARDDVNPTSRIVAAKHRS